ncbi:unnamed protein product [Nezara viridula]|uniref:Uncharacterized protein n=1 Tax=Nezara viridula TaxID=85310 RepID=A0A9P0E8U7_NEZVI|nr:unnamed protein product [Nezara viridula]
MKFVNEGWEDDPNSKRDLKEPAKLKKDPYFYIAFYMVYLFFFLVWEVATAFGSFLRSLILRPEPKSLKGRVCLVTGSGRGLGRQLCLALAKEGAVIACADINEANNKTTVAMVKELGAKAVAYTTNVAIKKDVEELVSKIENELGPIYLLINNAALVGAFHKIDEEYTRASFNINVLGPIWMMNAVLPSMESRNEGHIVNIASISSTFVSPLLSIYGATKTSLSYLSRCLRSDLLSRNKNIMVTTVYPTIINTSADYLRFVSTKINTVVEMEEVVEATLNAIHYNNDEVTVPSSFKYPAIILSRILPTITTNNIIKLNCEKWNVPSDEQREKLPWHDLAKNCSFI